MTAGTLFWLTGLSGAGKTTLAARLQATIEARALAVELLDGDVVRTHLSQGLGFSRADRDTNIQRIGFVAQLLTKHGVHTIVAAISPYRAARDAVRAQVPRFVEIYCAAPLAVVEARDPKGLYKKARAQQIAHFTGIDDPYEPPLNPELILDTAERTPEACLAQIMAYADAHELLGHRR